ncbi:DNA-binding ferritin-like protein (oxidative damage protectant) [Levilactobacillus namurensis DSM 19117]|uniref:DNA-binding ferritin-like protein (Oxidative damage protectant) n=1 Tax=Levilactobacillus namurensis DSM 19117 TaxID=1423773 RepID=A0A0R1JUX5_9LACO|nr:DNA starvation/stationary phase protection protein [Levilactobacillus namurensis]KRK74840.1 DNA-binding ferritin-like protein (oxidative damage protectant) [Levilactobacillus namurensis DSM 19117]GEO75099.1 DNA starvation/stationary phase protection protein [Levilactobacillus namurensis]HJE45527.1 DNA starvation/stationary phase protection protein [Levilactobacillus namurensis]
MTTTIEDRYAAEQAQTEHDHHVPTAGAMTNHILANLHISIVKFHQVRWSVKGPLALSVRQLLTEYIATYRRQFDALGELLLDEGEIVSTTTQEYHDYNMLQEGGDKKYYSAEDQVNELVHDADTHNLFIDRAIKLAEKEERPALAAFLVDLRGTNNHIIRELQALLGNDARDGLDEDDDDDDED